MPLSKERQQLWMREYRKRVRYNVIPKLVNPVIPKIDGLIIKGNRIIGVQPRIDNKLSIYNPYIHKSGDRVLVRQGKRLVEVTVPEINGDGHPYVE